MSQRFLFGVLVYALLCLSLSAQTAPGPTTSPGPTPSPVIDPFAPKPYAETEFPEWLKAIRRFEVITVGSFPISFLYVNLAYDVGRWVSKDPGSSDPAVKAAAAKYAPFLFAPPDKPTYTQEETTGLLLATLGVAVAVAIGDVVIGLIEQATADAKAATDKRNREAANRATASPSPGPSSAPSTSLEAPASSQAPALPGGSVP